MKKLRNLRVGILSMISLVIGLGLYLLGINTAYSQDRYVIPPTSSTYSHVPVISDAEMKKCIEVYNEALWIEKELNKASVNSYSQKSIDAYNKKVRQYHTHSQLA